MNEILSKLSNLNLNIDSRSAVEIAKMWQQVQYFKYALFSAVIIVISICFVVACFKANS